jgi:hypothetical protein
MKRGRRELLLLFTEELADAVYQTFMLFLRFLPALCQFGVEIFDLRKI